MSHPPEGCRDDDHVAVTSSASVVGAPATAQHYSPNKRSTLICRRAPDAEMFGVVVSGSLSARQDEWSTIELTSSYRSEDDPQKQKLLDRKVQEFRRGAAFWTGSSQQVKEVIGQFAPALPACSFRSGSRSSARPHFLRARVRARRCEPSLASLPQSPQVLRSKVREFGKSSFVGSVILVSPVNGAGPPRDRRARCRIDRKVAVTTLTWP